jgi:hypothetical protein
VRFTFDGDTSGGCSVPGFTHENQPPYVWEEELGAGQFSCAATLTNPGSHTLTATPFDGDSCTGAAGPPATVSFDVLSAGSAGAITQLGQPGKPEIKFD